MIGLYRWSRLRSLWGKNLGLRNNWLSKYRVIHKSLREFRPLRYSSRDGHAGGERVNRGRDTPSFCPTLQVLDMSTLGDAADVNPANSKERNAFLFPLHAMFRHDCPLAVKPASTIRRLVHTKTWRDSLLIDMLFSAVSVLVVAQPSSEVPGGLMNYPVYRPSRHRYRKCHISPVTRQVQDTR